LSRCLQFNLRPMAPQTVQMHLADVLAKEHIEADAGALRLLARAARGSMRDALSLTDQAIAFGAGALNEDGVRQMLGAVDRGHAVRIVEAIAAADGAALVAAVDALRGLGLSAAGTLEEMAALLQQMAVLQAVPEALDADDPDAPEAQRLAALIAADETQLLYSIALHGRGELGLAPDEYSGLVMVLLRMLAFRPKGEGAARRGPAAPAAGSTPTPRPAAVAAAPRTVVAQAAVVAPAPALRVPASASEPPPWMDEAPFEEDEVAERRPLAAREPAAPSHVAKPITFTPTVLGARWAELVAGLNAAGSISAFVRELAMQAQCVALDEQATPIVCRLRVERETLRASAPREKLQAALTVALQRAVRLEVEAGAAEDSPAKREAAERARRQAQAEQIIHDDPLVQALMAQYKTARIVPGSVKPH
ncbi:MAG: DNA polymerase III subunit gamma/tau C-terminal domain-containing protein, partial [Pseudomonadota bacterium]